MHPQTLTTEPIDETALIEQFDNLIYFVMHKMHITQVSSEWEDFYQIGRIGLLRAIRTHVPEKSSFKTYAHLCIFSEIRREFYSRGLKKRHPEEPDCSLTNLENVVHKTDCYPIEVVDLIEHLPICTKKYTRAHNPAYPKLILQYFFEVLNNNSGVKITDLVREYNLGYVYAQTLLRQQRDYMKKILLKEQ